MVKAARVIELETRRDLGIEAWLDEHKLTYEYNEELPLSRIDRAASLSNQARLEPLDEEVVERYAADMERGDLFPPIVCRRSGRRLVLIGGNHRTTAATHANLATLPAYIVDVEAELATVLTYEDNRRHGLPPSEEERLLQAQHLVETGWPAGDAARAVGISAKKLDQAILVVEADRRSVNLGVPSQRWNKLAKSVRWRLGQIRSDLVFGAAAEMAAKTSLSTGDAFEFVTRVNRSSSEDEALAVVALEGEARENQRRQEGRSKRGRGKSPRLVLLDAIAAITALKPIDVSDSCDNDDQAEYLAKKILEAASTLRDVRALL